jgi:hypothetical protein
MKIEVIKNDFGYAYTFNLKEPNGTASDLTGAVVKFKGTHSEFPNNQAESTMAVLDAANGIASFTVATDTFPIAGVYYGEIEAVYTTVKQVTYPGFTIVVLAKV